MRVVVKGGGVALSAIALMVMTGMQAVADTEGSVESEAVDAIAASAGAVLETAVPVTDADATVVADDGTVVEFSADASDGLMLTTADDAELEIALPFADEASTAEVVDGAVVYDNNNGSATTPVVHEDGTVQILTTIADTTAPTEYAYDFGAGASFYVFDDGSVAVLRTEAGETTPVGMIAAPWAVDVNGAAVPTHFEARGTSLVQVLDHVSSATEYPVVADPTISVGWGVYYHFNKAETKTIGKDWIAISAGSTTACAAAGAALGSLAPAIGTAIGGAVAGATCLSIVGPIAYTAGVAYNSSPMKCLYVQQVPGLGLKAGTYSDKRCK